MNDLVKKMVAIGNNQLLKKEKELPSFTENFSWNSKFSDMKKYSHLFVLGCIADKQIKAERAWSIPMKIAEGIGSFEFEDFEKLSLADFKLIFENKKFHRFNEDVATEYFLAIEKIRQDYQGLAYKIWTENTSSAAIFVKFLEFKGIGQKIASMAVNILLREFKEDVQNLQWIDISPDTHVTRVFKRTGLVKKNASKEEIVWTAKELYPSYPGVFDLAMFTIGREFCKSETPLCQDCILNLDCPKIINC